MIYNKQKQKITIVIPAYNEENRIISSIKKINTFMKSDKRFSDYEILVVDDGSKDNTYNIVKTLQKSIQKIILIKNPKNMGKGYSVKNGALHAKFDIILFSDADLSTPIEEIDNLAKYIDKYDVVIGTRTDSKKIKEKQPALRKFIGKAFSILKHLFFDLNIEDTQCGFKMFRGNALFKEQKIFGWAFDVELLYLAQKKGMKIKEVPIEWHNNIQSKVNPIRDSIKMFLELTRIKRLHR